MIYGASVFPVMPDDPSAFVFTPEAFGAAPDGTGDNTAALQAAIDAVEKRDGRGFSSSRREPTASAARSTCGAESG